MAKRLKLITYLVFIFIMLSLLNLSFAIGYDQPDVPLSVPSYTKVVRSGEPELVCELLLPERFVRADSRADQAILEKTRETSEYFCADKSSKPGFNQYRMSVHILKIMGYYRIISCIRNGVKKPSKTVNIFMKHTRILLSI